MIRASVHTRRVSSTARAVLWAALLFCLALACGAPSPNAKQPPASSDLTLAETEDSAQELESGELALGWQAPANVPSSREVPIDARDPSWGSPNAPVTLVAFVDLQCPFCARVQETLEQLKQDYGSPVLRVVYKHNPLPFHQDALPAALAAQAVYELAGPEAFSAYISTLYRNQRSLGDAELVQFAEDVGVDRQSLLSRVAAPNTRAKVDADVQLAQAIGATGTPAFRINGVTLTGAQPKEKFSELIDAELAAAKQLAARGVAPDRIYATRVAENFVKPEPRAPSTTVAKQDDDTTVWKVPVGKSPFRGSANAPVTIVQFSEYQCPFCKRVEPTLDELLKRYPTQIRIVFKHNPLPFHNRAMPASMLALEARAQRGDKAFWQAHTRLFESAPRLEDEDLLAIASELKLNKQRVKRAITQDTHKRTVAADQDLASDLEARGTPSFFINGRRLSGAQPVEKFSALIDEELAKAKALMSSKRLPAARVYDEIMKDAKGPPAPEKKSVPAPSAKNPSRGPARAPVVVQVFSDFQCPFCKRAVQTIEDLEKAYPGRVRVVWRNLPLPFHREARPAARAAMEAYAQRGSAGFWRMHDLIFADQSTNGLSRASLEAHAQKLGLDLGRFRQALDDGRHDAVIDADEAVAKTAGITGTPGFVINGYFVSGAQPLPAFKKVVDRALADLKQGKRPK